MNHGFDPCFSLLNCVLLFFIAFLLNSCWFTFFFIYIWIFYIFLSLLIHSKAFLVYISSCLILRYSFCISTIYNSLNLSLCPLCFQPFIFHAIYFLFIYISHTISFSCNLLFTFSLLLFFVLYKLNYYIV